MAFKFEERVDPQQFGKLWKPTNPGETLTGMVKEIGSKAFEKTDKDGKKRTENTPYIVIEGFTQKGGVSDSAPALWQTPAHTDLVRRIGNVKANDRVRVTLTGYGDKMSRKYTVEVDR